jgi:Protein of unknown function (DUF1153)/Sigma-70, region 4
MIKTDLTARNTKRWAIHRKAAVVMAVQTGEITLEEACCRYKISKEKVRRWQSAFRSLPVSTLSAIASIEPSQARKRSEASLILPNAAGVLSRLPSRQRVAVLLVGFDGRSYEEVANVMRGSLASIRRDLARARQCLREAAGIIDDGRELKLIERAERRITEEIQRMKRAEPSAAELPSPNPRRWVPRRKAAVVIAVQTGKITLEEACNRYQLSAEEFFAWKRALATHGLPGLRATGFKARN